MVDDANGKNTGVSVTTDESGSGEAVSADDGIELLAEGVKVGRFLVLERLGAGAMGVVYAAYDSKLDRKIALKLLRPQRGADPVKRQVRMEREAQAMAKLSHPNVSSIYDVGVHEDQVFLAMEYLSGGTLRQWMAAKKRGWREVLDMFINVGKGLAAAHAEGLIHRDFKPDNVLLDKNGVPKVVDFGLVRLSKELGAIDFGAHDDLVEDLVDVPLDASLALSMGTGPAGVTRTGVVAGTPAYMAPEQFFGRPIDARTDQFAFCVALHEGLYGQRPFPGEDALRLAVSVTEGVFRSPPRDRGVPTWVRRLVLRGLRSTPVARWDSMAALTHALNDDPAVKWRRRLIVGGTVGFILTSLLVARHMVVARRSESDHQIAAHLELARVAVATAHAKANGATVLRLRAFRAFDAFDRETGESLWRDTRALIPVVDMQYDRAERSFEAAAMLDQGRTEIRSQLADTRVEHLLFAEDFRLEGKAAVLQERLVAVDTDGSRRMSLAAPGHLTVRVSPPGAHVILRRYERDALSGRRQPGVIPLPGADEASQLFQAGSYLLAVDAPGLSSVLYPFEVRRGEKVAVELSMPPASAIPEGVVYVPAGESWFGDADEIMRAQFLGTVPIHRRRSDAFLVAKYETTYAEWIAFLETLPVDQRAANQPDVSVATRGSLRLREVNKDWQIAFQPTTHRYTASANEAIVYLGRRVHSRQSWLRFPVAGVSPTAVRQFLAWLDKTGKLPGARLCTEVEWERAARGADDRLFPHGDELAADDANIDVTYGRVDSAYGPDEVGSHRGSVSPFGVYDLAGNVFELVVSSLRRNELVIRGGAYYFQAINARSTNREAVPSTYRDVTTGIRVCASVKGERL